MATTLGSFAYTPDETPRRIESTTSHRRFTGPSAKRNEHSLNSSPRQNRSLPVPPQNRHSRFFSVSGSITQLRTSLRRRSQLLVDTSTQRSIRSSATFPSRSSRDSPSSTVTGSPVGLDSLQPAINASPPRVPLKALSPPSPEQVAPLFRLALETNPALATFVLLAASSGARRGEIVALRRRDLNVAEGVLSIERGIVLADGKLIERETKTHQGRRISLDTSTLAVLQAHLDQMDERAGFVGARPTADSFIFSDAADASSPWLPDSTTRAFRALCAKAGVNDVRLHDLRHYVATRLLSAGAFSTTLWRSIRATGPPRSQGLRTDLPTGHSPISRLQRAALISTLLSRDQRCQVSLHPARSLPSCSAADGASTRHCLSYPLRAAR